MKRSICILFYLALFAVSHSQELNFCGYNLKSPKISNWDTTNNNGLKAKLVDCPPFDHFATIKDDTLTMFRIKKPSDKDIQGALKKLRDKFGKEDTSLGQGMKDDMGLNEKTVKQEKGEMIKVWWFDDDCSLVFYWLDKFSAHLVYFTGQNFSASFSAEDFPERFEE